MGGGDKAPKAYTPANQPGADSAMFGALSGQTQQDAATAATTNAGYNAAYQGVVNNPNDLSMLAGVNAAAGTANSVAGSDLAAAGAANTAATATYGDANTAAGYAAPMASDAAALRAYAPMLAEFGFDPNMSEYNFGLKQTQDTANVGAAEAGMAGSPFGAGATNDAMAAYTRNYEASRSTKAMAALQALSSLYTGAGGLDMNAIGALTQAGNLRQGASSLAGDASNLGHTAAQTQAAAAAMPYAAQNQIYTDRTAALDEMVNGASATGANTRGDAAGFGSYLGIGQGATALDQNAAKINNANSFLGQLGQLAGVAVQVGAHFIPGYGG